MVFQASDTPLALRLRRLRRAVLARRRALAALSAAAAVLTGLQATSTPPQPTRTVLVAARDLPAGTVVAPADLARSAFLAGSVPDGATGSARGLLGRTTAGPVRRGEPLTDARLVGGSLLDGYPGRVAAPVRVADPGAVALLHVGEVVDVIAADPQGRRDAAVVASAVPVVALPEAPRETVPATGGLVVLAVDEETATRLAAAAVSAYLSVMITR